MNEPSSSVMFRCDKCSAVIKGELAFWIHLSTQHFEYYPYRCGYCAETGEIHSTTTEDKMKHHMETVHRVKDLKISIHKKHDIETQLQSIVDKCRLNTANSFAGLKNVLRQTCDVLNEGLESSIRSAYIREAPLSLQKQRESCVEAPETTIDEMVDTVKVEESPTKDGYHKNRAILSNKANLLSNDASIFTLPEEQSYKEFPVTSRGKLISITVVDEDFNENQQYSTETRNQTPVQSLSYDPVAKPMQRKRSLPVNNRMQTTTKRSNGISKKTNNSEMLHQCNECSYASARKDHLDIHVRTHTGEKPFKCDQCAFASAQKVNLDNHVRIHTGEKPFKCNMCPYAAAQNGSLKSHMRIHTGEKPFKCHNCVFTCATGSHLIYHLRTHTHEKPYKFSKCSYGGSTSSQV